MAEFFYNDSKPKTIRLRSEWDEIKLTLSASVEATDDAILIAGHSIVNKNGKVTIKDVQFNNHVVDEGEDLDNKTVAVIVDVSKFKVTDKEVEDVKLPVNCTLEWKAGDTSVGTHKISDELNAEENSVFNYVFTFKKASA
jgi:hypothetical protein